jgi:hypothetical protein
MPRRLRIAFPGGSPQAPRTLSGDHGRFTLTGRAAALTKEVPLVVNDVWEPLFTSSTIGASPTMANAWVAGCVIKTTGEWFFPHQQVASSTGGPWLFNPGTLTWRRTNTNTTDWWKGIAFRENYDVCYDADRDVVWISTGGPVGWNGAPSSPVYGGMRYDLATDVFYNVWPQSDGTYVATTDAQYFLTANKGLGLKGFDHKWFYAGGYLFTLGGWSVGGDQSFRKIDPATNVQTSLTAYGAGLPPMNQDDGRYTVTRAFRDSRSNRFYLFADDGALYTYDNVASAATRTWQLLTTTGSGPATTVGDPTGGDTGGVVYGCDENSNNIVAWAGSGLVIGTPGGNYRRSWVLDMSTLQWRAGPSAVGGDTVPGPGAAVQMSIDYDPVGKRTMLAYSPAGTFTTEIWAFRGGSPHPGKITSFALPAHAGSTYGVSYYGYPYTANGSSKHTNMCYCPLDNRIYVTGGDTASSATDGVWSVSLVDGSWRLDYGRPAYPETVAPFAYQDNEGLEWDSNRSAFLFWPGSGAFGYGPANTVPTNSPYAEGMWWFDPVAKSWTQDTTMFYGYLVTLASPNSTVGSSGAFAKTGMIHGGIYDAQTDIIYASTSVAGMSRYDVATRTRLGTTSFVGSTASPLASTGYTGVYWGETKWERIGRWIYMPTALYNGTNGYLALAKYNIDSRAFVWCALPPIPQFSGTPSIKEQRIGVSRDTIVWPKTVGPDGVISGIYLYDTVNDTWQVDTQVPGYGNMLCNAITSLPDGRVAFSGGVFGPQMTHIWFYEAF